jgi:phasin family protein
MASSETPKGKGVAKAGAATPKKADAPAPSGAALADKPAAQAEAAFKAVEAKAASTSKRAAEAVQPKPEGTDEMTKNSNETIRNEAADRFQSAFADINERAKEAMEKNVRIVEEMTDLTKGNVEALVASSRAAAQVLETLGREAADYGRRSFEEASTALKSFAEVRSPTEFFRLQGEYARSAFDSLVAESSKMSETVIKMAGDVAEPVTSRYAIAAERVKNVAL